jgi:hypothetical protein
MNIATYTRSLLRAAAKVHAASLQRVADAAEAAAEKAFDRAEDVALICERAEDALRIMKEEAGNAYHDAHLADVKASAIADAVEEEIGRLGQL